MPLNSMTRRGALLAGSAAVSFACSGRPEAQIESASLNGNWRLGPALPFAVQEIYPTLHLGKIHLAGGFVAENDTISGATDRHVIFDPAIGAWREGEKLPRPLHHPQIISFKKHLVVLGGFEVESAEAVWKMRSTGHVLVDFTAPESERTYPIEGLLMPPIDLTGVWMDIDDLPQPNGESVVCVLEDALHVCGGRTPRGESNATWNDHTDVSDHFVLTDWKDSWQRAAPLPTARNSAAAATIGSDWHVVGGRTVADGNTPAHEVYDAKEDRWRAAAPMPQGQGGLAAAAVGDTLYAFGGEYFNDGGGVYPEAWRYDPNTDSWSSIPDMPHPRHGLGAVSFKNEIYVIGGALEVGGSQTSNLVEIYAPA